MLSATSPAARAEPPPPGTAISFADLPGFAADDHAAAMAAFRVSCAAMLAGTAPLRQALPPPSALKAACVEVMALPVRIGERAARRFFETQFTPRRIGAAASGFLTGYYEPVVAGSLERTTTFATPLYGRPEDLVTAAPGQSFAGLDPMLTTALRRPDGQVVALPDRAGIEAGGLGPQVKPLVYVHEPVEAFFIQIQGSARIALPDGHLRRLVYAGRNGYPYSSIGKALVERLHVTPAQMGMTSLEAWVRAHGQGPGEAGTLLMQTNRSYIFFKFDDTLPAAAGPLGGSGVSLTPLRSLAVDRALWAYGLPVYVDAVLPWRRQTPSRFQRLMIAQDTGAAIVGPARADLFFGTGPAAARRAGSIRDTGTLYALWPKDEAGAP